MVPHEGGDRSEGLAQGERARGVADGRLDLAAMAHDARVSQQARDIGRPEPGHGLDVEAGEGGTEGLALAQDGQPRQPGLETLQAQLLEQALVIGHRPAPLGVVVMPVVVRRETGPVAAGGVSGETHA